MMSNQWQDKTRGGWPVENVRPYDGGDYVWQGVVEFHGVDRMHFTWTKDGLDIPGKTTNFDLVPLEAPVEAPVEASDARRAGNALLCLFSGETDCAAAVIAEGEEALRNAIAANWTGDPDSEETKSALQAIAEHNFCLESVLCFEFETGEATFQDVYTY
jgi:hypothetical protein